MTIKERLTQFAKSKEKSVRAFEIKTGLTIGYINAIRVSIQPDKVQSIASCYPELNIGWLMTGEGEMLKSDETSKNNIKEKAVLIHQSDPKDLEIIQLQRQMISDRDKIIKLMEKRIEMLEQNQVCFYPKYEDNPSSMEVNDVHVEYRASKP